MINSVGSLYVLVCAVAGGASAQAEAHPASAALPAALHYTYLALQYSHGCMMSCNLPHTRHQCLIA
jgi:hypothetical protein